MALNTLKCNRLTPLHYKGLTVYEAHTQERLNESISHCRTNADIITEGIIINQQDTDFALYHTIGYVVQGQLNLQTSHNCNTLQ